MTGPLVTFRWTYVFASDGQVLTSESTLRFRERDEVEAELVAQGYVVDGVRDAPDRPGREFVFVARRP
ncbi:SAM-dependent methyltransferase OS=Streptomyces violarus OX=67380 GN=FHS41_000677 PE=4 SV=1 [Streptomyces violarus]